MAQATEERSIGESKYRVTQLPGKKGRKMLLRLYKVFAPVFGSLIEGLDGGKKSLGDISVNSISGSLSALAMTFKEEDLEIFCEQFSSMTQLELTPGENNWVPLDKHFDQHFAGNYGAMFTWLGFCLEVNFASFFDAWGGLDAVIGMVKKLVNTSSKSPSPKESIGSSTESQVQHDTPTA
jgi:hypothetical protein